MIQIHYPLFVAFEHSPVAQSVEQVAVNHLVGGSSPSGGATREQIST